jgi:hypothetical protein
MMLFEFKNSLLAFMIFLDEKSLNVLLMLLFALATVSCALAVRFETPALMSSREGKDATALDNVFFAESAN